MPIGGNVFKTAPEPGGKSMRRDGSIRWSDEANVFSVFFRVDRPANLALKLVAGGSRRSTLRANIGEQSFDIVVDGAKKKAYDIGSTNVPVGYVRVDLQGVEREGDSFPALHDLIVVSETEDLKLTYVKSNEGNMFYWGRRGPSVHLRYEVPKDKPIRYAYTELTIPKGQDPVGSYFMANGFGEGYFGIQVNGPEERRVLFSVWSPFKTDNPRDVPKEQRIVTLGQGPGVRIGEFGNEGSGGQSILVYPWEAGKTYRFLNEVAPDGQGNTVYTAWFGDKSADEWRLIARFRRPKTDTNLKGFHSFLENFDPVRGHLTRQVGYSNVWICDADMEWHECTEARFSVDATGGGGHRLDFAGGSEGTSFFLRNCGFFDETVRAGEVFTRESTLDQQPKIDFDSLPRK